MKKLFVCILALGFSLSLNAQNANDPVLFDINGKQIHQSEFMKEFLRSVDKDPNAGPSASAMQKSKALTDYAELFVNFRVKLEDAYAKGFDTLPSLVGELKGYRDELAQPYLIDSATMQQLLLEAYERNHYVLHAAHILVACRSNASPADTMKAFDEAMEFYNRVTKGGEDFMTVAKESVVRRLDKEKVAPDDPRRQDNGDLGNFTVFEMVYPFECGAYALQPGEVSLPVRSNYGYHIIKLFSKTPYYGRTTMQHIWVPFAGDSVMARNRVFEAYNALKQGRDFASVCRRYSMDRNTSDKGGQISEVTQRQLPPEYVETIARLNPGEYSEPFLTERGWHIVLLNNKESLPDFDDMVPYYKQRMARDRRSAKPRQQFIEQSKRHYNFIDFTKTPVPSSNAKGKKKPSNTPVAMMASLDECRAAVNDSILRRLWVYRESMITNNSPLFKIGDEEHTPREFLVFLQNNMRYEPDLDLETYFNNKYETFVNNKVFEYADKHLEDFNPDFAALVKEYRNGLMIFAYNDENVWRKAVADTVGLEAFYQSESKKHSMSNPDDAPYFWNQRANITLAYVDDSTMLAPEKALKLFQKATKKNWPIGKLSDELNDAMKTEGKIKVEEIVVEKEHQNILNDNQWQTGIYVLPTSMGYRVVRVNALIQPCLKSRSEARGYYINDYQNYLDAELIKSLRNKYNVKIYWDAIKAIRY